MIDTPPTADEFNWPAPPVQNAVATYRRVTSYVIFAQRAGVRVTGGLEAHVAAHRAAQRHTLVAGWWGFPFGLMWTPATLLANNRTLRSARELLASGVAKAGWFRDPSTRFSERYWDGAQWTDQVRQTTTDSPPPAP